MATATENEGSSGRYDRYVEGAGPISWMGGGEKAWIIWTEYFGSVRRWQQRPIISMCWACL